MKHLGPVEVYNRTVVFISSLDLHRPGVRACVAGADLEDWWRRSVLGWYTLGELESSNDLAEQHRRQQKRRQRRREERGSEKGR
jgi:hypothetical protein